MKIVSVEQLKCVGKYTCVYLSTENCKDVRCLSIERQDGKNVVFVDEKDVMKEVIL